MASNTKSSNTAVLLRLKQYKMEPTLPVTQKPILETSWKDVKNSCKPLTKRSK